MKVLGYNAVVALAFVAFSLGACSPKITSSGDEAGYGDESPAASMTAEEASMVESQAVNPATDAALWVGKWQGPEATSLTITAAAQGYDITIRNLDGPRDFTGTAGPSGIAIVRDGQALTIHKGSGEDTGMKWLADKKDCLIVAANEGYCRD